MMMLNYADVPPNQPEGSYYKIMYKMDDKEFNERGGLHPGEFMDTLIVPGSISRSPIKEIPTAIRNARVDGGLGPSISVQGFRLGHHKVAPVCYDFEQYDEGSYTKWLQTDLLPKVAAQVLHCCSEDLRPVSAVHAIDYTLRCTDGAGPSPALPVLEAHADFTPASGRKRISTSPSIFTHGDPAPITLDDDIMIINVWQPLVPVVFRKPLVMCDIRTVAADEYVVKKMIFKERVGEVYNLVSNQDHQKWYYYPHMTNSECLVFKTWAPDGSTVPHSGAIDTTDPVDAPPRRSMETRWIIKFAKR